jgi:hypothetical protein
MADKNAVSITREELYEMVWTESMVKVGEKLGISSSYMTRLCKMMNVPRPAVGYWAKLEAGKAKPKPRLPDPEPTDLLIWNRGTYLVAPRLKGSELSLNKIAVPKKFSVTSVHNLVSDAKKHLQKSRDVKENEHLAPYKKLMLHVVVSKKSVDPILHLINKLLLALESEGYPVLIAPEHLQLYYESITDKDVDDNKDNRDSSNFWSPWRATIVYVGNVPIRLSFIEVREPCLYRYVRGNYIKDSEYVLPKSKYHLDHTWTTTMLDPTGRLKVQASSTRYRVEWKKTWVGKGKEFEGMVPSIVKELEKGAKELIELNKQADIEEEKERIERDAEKLRQKLERRREQTLKSIELSRNGIEELIKRWGEAIDVENFFKGVESRLEQVNPDNKDQLLKRLHLARNLMGSIDPLDYFEEWKTPRELIRTRETRRKDGYDVFGSEYDDEYDDY